MNIPKINAHKESSLSTAVFKMYTYLTIGSIINVTVTAPA
jgi:hypothetical protein